MGKCIRCDELKNGMFCNDCGMPLDIDLKFLPSISVKDSDDKCSYCLAVLPVGENNYCPNCGELL